MKTVPVTIVADGVWLDDGRTRYANRGDAARLPDDVAARLVAEQKAVVIDINKLGVRQCALLLQLYKSEVDELRESLVDPSTGARRTARRLRRPPRPKWNIRNDLRVRDADPVTEPAYVRARRGLIRRGLLLAYDRQLDAGVERNMHTSATRLTEIGRRFAICMHAQRADGRPRADEMRSLRQLLESIE